MARENKRLLTFFRDYDLNHDLSIDVNEWMLMLPYLHRSFLAALSVSPDAPHRNRVLRALRVGKRVIAERRQQELFEAADRGEELPEGPVDASLMLSGLAAAVSAEAGDDGVQQRREGRSVAVAVMAAQEKRREKRKEKGARRRRK